MARLTGRWPADIQNEGHRYVQRLTQPTTPGCALVSLLKVLAYPPNKKSAISGDLPRYSPPETKDLMQKAKLAVKVMARGDENLAAWLYQLQAAIRQRVIDGTMHWPLVCAVPLDTGANAKVACTKITPAQKVVIAEAAVRKYGALIKAAAAEAVAKQLSCYSVLTARMRRWWEAPLGQGAGGIQDQVKPFIYHICIPGSLETR